MILVILGIVAWLVAGIAGAILMINDMRKELGEINLAMLMFGIILIASGGVSLFIGLMILGEKIVIWEKD